MLEKKIQSPFVMDPTQTTSQGCCGNGVYWDFETLQWRQAPVVETSAPDCSQVAQALVEEQGKVADRDRQIADKDNQLTVKDNRITELEGQLRTANQSLTDKTQEVADKMQELAQAKARISELENAPPTQVDECAILAKYLDPVRDTHGTLLFYGLKNAPGCPDVSTVNAQDTNNNTITSVVTANGDTVQPSGTPS